MATSSTNYKYCITTTRTYLPSPPGTPLYTTRNILIESLKVVMAIKEPAGLSILFSLLEAHFTPWSVNYLYYEWFMLLLLTNALFWKDIAWKWLFKVFFLSVMPSSFILFEWKERVLYIDSCYVKYYEIRESWNWSANSGMGHTFL